MNLISDFRSQRLNVWLVHGFWELAWPEIFTLNSTMAALEPLRRLTRL